ncbi:SH3 domain-containing protein [Pedobacter sp. BS3]|uniref:SH3 domain-containing protein n=1 Tax=Pedobacter sp. BS3 TaxID=2567937 RepID=UPI0011EF2F58|nr:SH3 domain-containing protein [Pedobacter sp. BS3]TZF81782.1 SH3 domain-containing protein [Pedobacter sp. BS3]
MKKNLVKKALCFIYCSFLLSISCSNMYAKELYRINTERLNVRKLPNPNSKVFGYISKGQMVEVLGKSGFWYKIQVGKEIGYVDMHYLIKSPNIDNSNEEEITIHNYKVIAGASLIIILTFIIVKLFSSKNRTEIIHDQGLHHQQIVIKQKSVGLAIVLTLLFGPIGMLYSTVRGAIIMILLPLVLFLVSVIFFSLNFKLMGAALILSLIIFLIFYWLICIIWAASAANSSNKIIINTPIIPNEK